jgi:hypothetical protein
MTGTLVILFAPSFGQYPLPRVAATKGLIVLKHRIDHRQHFSRHGDLGRRSAAAPTNSTIQTLKAGIAIGGMDTDLHADPP